MVEERVQKLIAHSGLCSRRQADELVREGRVTVNGRVAQPGDRADAAVDHVKVDGKLLSRAETMRYLLLYKPPAVMTTCDDPEGRTTVVDLVRPVVKERVYPVGRLDYQSEGLLLLTNDGELAARVSHPRYGVVREYLAKVRGDLDERELEALLKGTVIDGRRVVPRSARRRFLTRGGNSWWQVEITEGRTHEVRELFFRVGHRVQRLRRTAIGPIRDDALRPGDFRFLDEGEVDALRTATSAGARGGRRRGHTEQGPRPEAPPHPGRARRKG